MNLSPHPTSGLVCSPFQCGGSVFVDLLFIVALVVCWGSVFVRVLLFSTLCHCSFAIILMEKRELDAFL